MKPADSNSEEYVLEEESIVGEYQERTGGDLFLDLQASPNIAAGISKEEFTQSGISDAAGAVSKIAGANIVGGKYAVVRGLGDRYSNTLVNGALISSADPSKKAVQLDLFPSDLLESVAINRAKKLFKAMVQPSLETFLDMETWAQGLTLLSDDHKEGAAAFLQKRKAQFRGL